MVKKSKQTQTASEESKGFKDSVLGKISVEWEVVGLLNTCDLINGRAFKPKEWYEDGLPIVRIENLNNEEACFNYCNFKVPDKYILQSGDLLISWSGTPGTSFGIFFWNRGKAVLNQHIFKVVLKEGINNNYFYYAYKNLLAEMIRQSHGGVGLQHITKEDLKRLQFLVPPLPEQSAIASILSTADEAIEKTDQLIAKYKRIKQGLMQDLFRYGIDENGQIRSEQTHRFKDSPLGRIPEEWVVVTLLEVIPKAQYGISSSLNDRDGIPVLRMNNLQHGKIDISDLRFSDNQEAYKMVLKPNDILFNRTNSYEHVGRTSIWNNEIEVASFASYLVRLVADLNKIDPHYLNYWLNLPEIQNAIRKYATPAVHQVNINPTNLRKCFIKLPPLPDQSRIASVLSTADEAIEKEQAYKNKLLALKRGLMEDLLTGKVRVTEIGNNSGIMKFAGCWEDMPKEDFQEFVQEVAERRQQAFGKRRKQEELPCPPLEKE